MITTITTATYPFNASLYNNPRFRDKVRQILSLSSIKRKYIDKMTEEDGMKLYEQVFTHSSVHETNYEWLEILGDATLNKCVVWYINERFPQLHNADGVKVIARLKINMVSKTNFSEIAEKLGFASFIRINEENVKANKIISIKSLLEDVLEAFFGATEMLIDRLVSPGAGYGICYHLFKNIMDPIPISLEYEDLYDPITRLKETFDIYRTQLWGQVRYESHRQEAGGHIVHVYQSDPATGRRALLASAQGDTLDETKQQGAIKAIEVLTKKGFRRPIPEYYHRIAVANTC
jgi:dsRNA-specific ribonuclease